MWVSKRWGSLLRASLTASSTVRTPDRRQSVTQVGGASSISPASRRAMASAGRSHSWSRISALSTATSTASGAGARKNQVEKRLGATGGGSQWENGTRVSPSTTTAASSFASRTAARLAALSSSPGCAGSMSSFSTWPPGNTHMPPKAPRELRRSMSTSMPSSVSRAKTTVAAGIGSMLSSVTPLSRHALREHLEAQLLELSGEELGIVEHPVVVDAPVAGRTADDGERGVQVLGEVPAVGAEQDAVALGPQHMAGDAGGHDRLDVVAAIAGEAPPGGAHELHGVGEERLEEGLGRRHARHAQQAG